MFWRTPHARSPVTEIERLEVADFVMRGVPIGISAPCICDDCIRRRWRPIIRLAAPVGWPHFRDEVVASYRQSVT